MEQSRTYQFQSDATADLRRKLHRRRNLITHFRTGDAPTKWQLILHAFFIVVTAFFYHDFKEFPLYYVIFLGHLVSFILRFRKYLKAKQAQA